MEFVKDGDEEELHLHIERVRHDLLVLLSDDDDDNQHSFHARSNVSKDPIVHGSCGCTNSSYSESQVHKIHDYAKVEMVHRVNKVLKPKNGNGTGVFYSRASWAYQPKE